MGVPRRTLLISRRTKSVPSLATAALFALYQLACGSNEGGAGPTPTPSGDFESANPAGPDQGSGASGNVAGGSTVASATNGSTGTTGGMATDGGGGSGGGDGGEEPGRLIEEAD